MADIRINSLSTTATSSASDDYIAIDGAANGTRKFSAYSPTFGGPVTVSSSANGSPLLTINQTGAANAEYGIKFTSASSNAASRNWELSPDTNAYGDFVFKQSNAAGGDPFTAGTTRLTISAAGNLIAAGNLTVSGTGTSSVAGKWLVGSTTAPSGGSATILAAASVGGGVQFANTVGNNGGLINAVNGAGLTFYSYTGALGAESYTELARFVSGNLLLGTTTDSGNGKLQLANHNAITGGIGFGTDTSLYRNAAAQLATNAGTFTGGVGVGYFSITTSGVSPLVLGTNGVEGARINPSNNNFELSGALKLSSTYAAGAPAATGYVTLKDSTGTTYKVLVST